MKVYSRGWASISLPGSGGGVFLFSTPGPALFFLPQARLTIVHFNLITVASNTPLDHPLFSSSKEAGFTELFEKYFPRLCLYAFEMVKDKSVAEDLVQDCYLKLWSKRGELDYVSLSASYLYTMVRHSVYNYRRDNNGVTLLDDDSGVTDGENQLRHLIEAETFHAIYQAMKTLPPKCRLVFDKLYVEGKAYEQIADEMNVSVSTIRNQKSKGIAHLREKLGLISLFLFYFLTE